MQEHDHKIALERFLLADAQVLDLLDQIGDIEALESPLPQETCLVLDSKAEIALVERRTLVDQRVCVPPLPVAELPL